MLQDTHLSLAGKDGFLTGLMEIVHFIGVSPHWLAI
jgi:hypothetical protein